ncbi:NAD(P)-dependent oxidoreductase [Streptomyces sp. SID12488]|uniref:NAD(P)-dependent oxidoreductase n=1 Tax=Streptomyces sp. SID12488 TaxID=2706040 RepID=UPI0013D8FF5E|nr:NAD(P)-dependent oxidoreductase [Streptomyces sp. SID12488]NEA63738.1 NAD(P)-dependent oxidoreductase [Streptomyces sp. SID12488]
MSTDQSAGTGTAVAVVGLGVMGGGIARRLLARGITPTVWNRSPEPARAVAELGATVTRTPALAARHADVVLVSLADGTATEQALLGPDGVLADGPIDGVLASASTISPDLLRVLRERTPHVLDLGLLGNGHHAENGELRIYVGGTDKDLARAQHVLDAIAKQVVHIGGPGDGMRLKLLMNTLMGIQVQAMAEATALGESVGLDRAVVLDAITVSGFATPVMGFKARRLAAGRYDDPDFRLRLMAKDLSLAVAEADRTGLGLPLVQAALATHEESVRRGDGDLDCAAVARTVAAPNGEGTRP